MTAESKYIYGKKPVLEALKVIKTGTLIIKSGLEDKDIDDIKRKALSKNIGITYIDTGGFKKKFGDARTQGIALKVEEDFTDGLKENNLRALIKDDTKKNMTILVLDGIEDVGNLGAALRSALLFGVDCVILPKDNSPPINEVVVKRSAGAAAHLKIIYVTNLVRTIEELKESGFWIYAADKNGEDIRGVKFDNKCALVMGSEHKGIRPLVRKHCDIAVKIPTNGKLDSLNLSVSAGIILYEIYAKRGADGNKR